MLLRILPTSVIYAYQPIGNMITDDIFNAIRSDEDEAMTTLLGISDSDTENEEQTQNIIDEDNQTAENKSDENTGESDNTVSVSRSNKHNSHIGATPKFDPEHWHCYHIWPRTSRRMTALQLAVREGVLF